MARTGALHPDGPKDLSWAGQYVESNNRHDVEEKTKVEGFMSRKQTLEAEGIDTEGMDEARFRV